MQQKRKSESLQVQEGIMCFSWFEDGGGEGSNARRHGGDLRKKRGPQGTAGRNQEPQPYKHKELYFANLNELGSRFYRP